MNRKDWVWIGLKMFGVYLAIQAVLILPPMMSTFFVLWETTNAFRYPASAALWMPFWQQIISLILTSILSLYLLGSGRLIYWLIGPSIPAPTKEERSSGS